MYHLILRNGCVIDVSMAAPIDPRKPPVRPHRRAVPHVERKGGEDEVGMIAEALFARAHAFGREQLEPGSPGPSLMRAVTVSRGDGSAKDGAGEIRMALVQHPVIPRLLNVYVLGKDAASAVDGMMIGSVVDGDREVLMAMVKKVLTGAKAERPARGPARIRSVADLSKAVTAAAEQVVLEGTRRTMDGSYTATPAILKDILVPEDIHAYLHLIAHELGERAEVASVTMSGDGTDSLLVQFDLAYCPCYAWKEGDGDRMDCSFQDWMSSLKAPGKGLSMARLAEIGAAATELLLSTSSGPRKSCLITQLGMTDAEVDEYFRICRKRGEAEPND